MRKYHYYVDPDTHALNLADTALSVRGDAKVETLVFIFPENFDIDTTSSVLRVYYDLPGHKGPSLFETLNQAVAGAGGVRLTEWMVDKIHTDTPGRLSFSLAVIADEGVRWISRKTWIPVTDSHYHSDSQEQEKPYLSRLEAAEAAIAAMRTGKQDALTFDETPTEGSSNPVTSGGAFAAIKESGGGMVSTTWAELKVLRDEGQLIPGQTYRITDYICATTQDGTRVESHPYDIIVTADSETALSEIARACTHDAESAEYYQYALIEAWELKYSLDNNKNRFAWADEENGHGVVYYLKDDHGNECPYDFKQIQFIRYKITTCTVSSLVGKYTSLQHGEAITGIDEQNPVWCYTFSYDPESTGIMSDASVMEFNADNNVDVSGNVIKAFHSYQNSDEDTALQIAALNSIVFFGNVCKFNTFGNNGYFNTFGNNCLSNTFGDNFLTNVFGDNCQFNAFGGNCHSNTSGNGYSSNVFGNFCASNTFGDNCSSNRFGNGCTSNMFNGTCSANTFGNNCSSNVLKYNCLSNIFGNSCHSNTFEFGSHTNIFGAKCHDNTFGSSVYFNTLGNECVYNTFGNNCFSNTFGDSCNYNTLGDVCGYNTFWGGCRYIDISGGTFSQIKKYYHVLGGVQGTKNSRVSITGTNNNNFVTYVGLNSSGELKMWIPADLAQ